MNWRDGSRTLYDALARCLDALKGHGVRAVFLSTESHRSKVTASKPLHPSGRVSRSDYELPAPFTELPFDCPWNEGSIVTDKSLRLQDIVKLDFLALFGRPLFVYFLDSATLY